MSRSPSFGPLAFNGAGDVLMRTSSGVVRVDRTSFTEAPIDGAARWPSRVAPVTVGPQAAPNPGAPGAPAWTLAAVEARCDAPTLVARFEATDAPLVALPVLAPSRCAATESVPAEVVGRAGEALLLAVRGEVIAIPEQPPLRATLAESLAAPLGSPVPLGATRSPDGATFAYPAPRGILVATVKGVGRAATARLWPGPLADGASSCVPSYKGERLACVLGSSAAIYEAK